MRFGTAYYPELIPESEWEHDLTIARDHGIEAMRVFEFAWSALEPREQVYAWEWADRFVDLCERLGLKLVLCTPSATPPTWMTRQYPEMMVELRNGTSRDVGGRRDIDIDNPIYQDFCCTMSAAMAKRWGRRVHVIGWQIDNELCGAEFAPPESHTAHNQFEFRRWLKQQHPTVEHLNASWGTRFWSQEYSDWGDVGTPRNCRVTHGHVMDYSRFYSASIAAFVKRCRAAMTPYTDLPIGHNHTAVFDRGIDHQVTADVSDITGWDAYPGAAGGCISDYRNAAAGMAHDWFRTMRRAPFWVWETSPFDDSQNQAFLAQMHAGGASWCHVWHWRRHRPNVEQGGRSPIGFDGQPFAEHFALLDAIRARPELHETLPDVMPRRDVALVFNTDNVAVEMRNYLRDEPRPHATSLRAMIHAYHAAWRAGLGMDVVRPQDDLSGYKLIIVAGARCLSDAAAANIANAVRNGASLVAGGPLAMQDQFGVYRRTPGQEFADIIGFTPREHNRNTGPYAISGDVTGEITEDAIAIPDDAGTVIARFSAGRFAGQPAVISRLNNRVHYCAGPGSTAWYPVIQRAASACGLTTIDNPHEDVGSTPHFDGKRRWYFNHHAESKTVAGHTIPGRDFLLV